MARVQVTRLRTGPVGHEAAAHTRRKKPARRSSPPRAGVRLPGGRPMTLGGRVAVVTGGSQGIGKAVVRRLLEEGAKVVFCARRMQNIKATAEELASIATGLLPIQADGTREADTDELVRATLEQFSRIDILVS